MGWTSTNKPAGMTAAEFLKTRWGADASKIIASAQVGEYLYFAYKTAVEGWSADYYDAAPDGTITAALVYLVENERLDGYNFAYKDMDETVGPYDEGKCPGSILKLLSPLKPGERTKYAAEWRARQKAWKRIASQPELAL